MDGAIAGGQITHLLERADRRIGNIQETPDFAHRGVARRLRKQRYRSPESPGSWRVRKDESSAGIPLRLLAVATSRISGRPMTFLLAVAGVPYSERLHIARRQ